MKSGRPQLVNFSLTAWSGYLSFYITLEAYLEPSRISTMKLHPSICDKSYANVFQNAFYVYFEHI